MAGPDRGRTGESSCDHASDPGTHLVRAAAERTGIHRGRHDPFCLHVLGFWQPALAARCRDGFRSVCHRARRFHLRLGCADGVRRVFVMETLSALASGFAVALTPQNLLWALAGVTLGTAVGVLPGIGPALTVALLLPVTYSLDPTAAFIMFAGIYYGGVYGGSTTSILLNTPGESASVMSDRKSVV